MHFFTKMKLFCTCCSKRCFLQLMISTFLWLCFFFLILHWVLQPNCPKYPQNVFYNWYVHKRVHSRSTQSIWYSCSLSFFYPSKSLLMTLICRQDLAWCPTRKLILLHLCGPSSRGHLVVCVSQILSSEN